MSSVTPPEVLVREARLGARLTQAQLAQRLGTTQSAVARLERRGANPRINTVAQTLEACGRQLDLGSRRQDHRSSVDETLVARQLRLTPGERLLSLERAYSDARTLALAGQRARGELA